MNSLADVLKDKQRCIESYNRLTPKEQEQNYADVYNKSLGDLNEKDGYNCELCNNKGYVAVVVEDKENGKEPEYRLVMKECNCKKIRRSIMLMKKSGLEGVLKKYSWEKYETTESWQETLKNKSMEFAKEGMGTFFLGGMTGAGKTFLCTCIARELLFRGNELLYILWREESQKLKALVNTLEYNTRIDKLKSVDVLYIDDFLKTPNKAAPTSADLSLALEIINSRYNDSKTTIISTEWTIGDIVAFDEALGGRIYEMAKTNVINIKEDSKKNYRLKGCIEI